MAPRDSPWPEMRERTGRGIRVPERSAARDRIQSSLPLFIIGIGLIVIAVLTAHLGGSATAGRSPLWVLFLLVGITLTAGGTLMLFAEPDPEDSSAPVPRPGFHFVPDEEWETISRRLRQSNSTTVRERPAVRSAVTPAVPGVNARAPPSGPSEPSVGRPAPLAATAASSQRVSALETALSEIEQGLARLPPIGGRKLDRSFVKDAMPAAPSDHREPGGPSRSRDIEPENPTSAADPLPARRPGASPGAAAAPAAAPGAGVKFLPAAVPSRTEYEDALKTLGLPPEWLEPEDSRPGSVGRKPLALACVGCGSTSLPRATECSRCGRPMCSNCTEASRTDGRAGVCPICAILDDFTNGRVDPVPFRLTTGA
jgi:hypothetical protein